MAGCRRISKADWRAAGTGIPSVRPAAGLIAHMNAEHADAMVLYCTAFSKATRDHLREHDGRRQVRLRNVGDDPKGATTRPSGVPQSR